MCIANFHSSSEAFLPDDRDKLASIPHGRSSFYCMSCHIWMSGLKEFCDVDYSDFLRLCLVEISNTGVPWSYILR